jgi:hypothetical protein
VNVRIFDGFNTLLLTTFIRTVTFTMIADTGLVRMVTQNVPRTVCATA